MESKKRKQQESLRLDYENLKIRITEKKQWDKKSVNSLLKFLELTIELFEDHETRLDEVQNLQPEKDDEEAISISLSKKSDGEDEPESEKSQDDELENSDDQDFIDDDEPKNNPKKDKTKQKLQKPI